MSAYSRGMFDIENGEMEYASKAGLGFLFDIVVIGTLFSVVFVHKLDGKLRWSWGKRKKY